MILLLLFCAAMAQAAQPATIPVNRILEQPFKGDDLAVVVPDRLELICKSGASSPWGFSFAGFETKWTHPLELEVTGSGGYEHRDIFSVAALTLDYGGKSGWIERSFVGLGLIQATRAPHPPSWGVGSDGKFIMRENLINADPKPQHITLDPAKYAPKGWDGRLWIGLALHNVGSSKSVSVRVLNSADSHTLVPEPDQNALLNLVRDHQRAFLKWQIDALEKAVREAAKPQKFHVAPEMAAYDSSLLKNGAHNVALEQYREALGQIGDKPLGADRFMKLVGSTCNSAGQTAAATTARKDTTNTLNGFLSSWKSSGQFGKEIGCIIRTASNLDKIGLTDVETGRVLGTNSAPIRISAARHEYEGFQVVLSPLTGCATKVGVAVTDLKGTKLSIPASNITVNPVGYVRLFNGTPREMLCPDPLLIGAVPNLKPGENQPVWITVRVPDDAPEGDYTGSVLISAAKAKDLRIPLVLKVRDFDIPKKISLRSSFWMFRDQLNRFYHLDEISFDDYMKWIDFCLQHRLCPVDVYEGRCKPLLDVAIEPKDVGIGKGVGVLPNPNPDFTLWDKFIDHMLAGGASTIHLGQSHHQGAWFSDKDNPTSSPVQVQRVIDNLKVLRKHYQDRGVFDLHYMQLRDETSAPEALNVYREVAKEMPDVKLLLTAPSSEARPFLNIPCPLTPGFDARWRDEVKAKGGEYWWYVCCAPSDPAWANLFIHQTAAQHRALFWQTWRNDVDGLLYWGLNYWTGYGPDWPAGTKCPTDRVPGVNSPNFCPLADAPGDGFSMYPGPTASQPMSSIRLEVMRDGEEDYEYFRLLDRLIVDADKRGKDGPALRNAKALRAKASALVADMTHYEKNGTPYLAIRNSVGDAIEALLHQ